MPLSDRPDFQAWLRRFEDRHEELHGEGLRPPADRCDGCGAPLEEPPSTTSLCLICLAEQYGRDQAQAAARIAGALYAALAREPDTPIDDVRDAIDKVLDDHERSLGGRGDL
jgi:recombinational DNA repair protein (RecF pathway)